MYEPWKGEKFDLIIESISAIAKKVAKVSLGIKMAYLVIAARMAQI